MKTKVRQNIFETASSSVHSLTITNQPPTYYNDDSEVLRVQFTTSYSSCYSYETLNEKVSYIVSHIASWYKYNASDYKELKETIKSNYWYRFLKKHLKEEYDKTLKLPKKSIMADYEEGIHDWDFIYIDHQIISENMEDLLSDMNELGYWENYGQAIDDSEMDTEELLKEILKDKYIIQIGRD